MSLYKTVGVGTSYGLEVRCWIPAKGKKFSLFYSIQTGPGVHPASYSMGKGDYFSVSKAAG
jgi:hypothetical protein